MPEYRGNAIYDYVVAHRLKYYFSAADNWVLVYGDSASIPKVLVFACKVRDIAEPFTRVEGNNANQALKMALWLNLPFLYVRFMVNSDKVSIWESGERVWKTISYDKLRDLFEGYGVVQPGTAKKPVNQYVSSPYHDWQRQNLGRITVSDFDLLKYENGQIAEIVELKRSKISINRWMPYSDDFPNFALLINTIVRSEKKIPFTLYYNEMRDGPIGAREEDISRIKVFQFVIPDRMIDSQQIQYRSLGIHRPEELLR